MGEALMKKELFQNALRGAGLEAAFEVVEEDNIYVFRAVQDIKNGRVLVLIILDDTLYATGSIIFGTLDDFTKKDKMLRLFNEMNSEYKHTRFYIGDDNELVCQMSYIASSDSFQADIFLKTFVAMFANLESQDYPRVMRVLWS